MHAEIIGPDILIVLIVGLILILPIWAAIDAGGKPGWAFERAGTNKTLWIVLPIIGIFVCGFVGIVSGIVWFASIRAKVVSAMSDGNPPSQVAFGGTRAVPPPPAASATPPGWFADPAGAHELRYFDGRDWTAHVSDGGSQGLDPL
jgi:hypothetical protein